MDFQIPLIFVSLFSLASVVLVFIYKFGIKEKSYEEAIAEQRQQTQILLGMKPKSKDKKSRKLSKKVKEKSSSESESINLEKNGAIIVETNGETLKKPHVEFKEDPEEVPIKNNTVNKKQTKKDKVRPILVHKESTEKDIGGVLIEENPSLSLNHFEELHPKDDFELFKSNGHPEDNSKEECEKTENNKSSTNSESEVKKVINKKEQEVAPPQPQKENIVAPSNAPINGVITNSAKEKKKKKSEAATLQQLAGDTNGPNVSVLLSLVRKAELSRSEVQILIDLLLNKQHENPVIMDEWSEGKSDPVQKLKRQLAEKEKLLAEEQQVVVNTQTKLREIRAEHQSERSVLQQKLRGLEEGFQTKQMEATRLHQQLQQLQAQMKEELVKSHKLRDEHAAMQLQRQQVEMRLAQAQESDVLITQLQTEVQELGNINNQLRMELSRLTEENRAEKERQQGFIVQLNTFQKEMEQATDRNRKLEESRIEMERNLEKILKQESEFKSEIGHLNATLQQQKEEILRLEHGKQQYQEEVQKQKDESSKLICQLKLEIQNLKDENTQMQAQAVHMNGSLQETKQYEVEILNLHNELSSIKNQLNETENRNEIELKSANATVVKLQTELRELKAKLEEEKSKLEEQKLKNNELRTKNWKVMEALNAAESRIKIGGQKSKSEKDIQREFVQRLFPEMKELDNITSEDFELDCQKYIKKYFDNYKKKQTKEGGEDVRQLKSQIQHYKNAIDNAEKMLNKLQEHIEQEEINWRMQLAAKTAELEAVKEKYSLELQDKLHQLEKELKAEQEDKNRIMIQFQEYKSNSQNGVQRMPEEQFCNPPSNGVH